MSHVPRETGPDSTRRRRSERGAQSREVFFWTFLPNVLDCARCVAGGCASSSGLVVRRPREEGSLSQAQGPARAAVSSGGACRWVAPGPLPAGLSVRPSCPCCVYVRLGGPGHSPASAPKRHKSSRHVSGCHSRSAAQPVPASDALGLAGLGPGTEVDHRRGPRASAGCVRGRWPPAVAAELRAPRPTFRQQCSPRCAAFTHGCRTAVRTLARWQGTRAGVPTWKWVDTDC